ncbi:hypothetical protein LB456_05445 [Psychroflexus sp. CAK57W]|uniref:hypothetical protein n=1 Tax=Psychroflexus curvus TaxID=2873595 RepID=UPI001CCD3E70|nr:hypothetical protein [Psychroflexus curvus]MBZ9786897.1 hypothetical protein [Psychroflexus curvus]
MKLKYLNLFLLLCLAYLGIGIITQELLKTEILLAETLLEQFTRDQVLEVINFNRKWEWITYILLPIVLLLKIAMIAKIIDVGVFFMDKKISYNKLFSTVLKAEFIFLLAPVLKLGWFYFIETDFALVDLQNFYPLSLINITGYENLENWFIYPFQAMNLIEVAYWFILAFQLKKILEVDFDKSFSIVMSSYGVILLIWIIAVMFFTLNMS